MNSCTILVMGILSCLPGRGMASQGSAAAAADPNFIIIYMLPQLIDAADPVSIKGRVINTYDEPQENVSVKLPA